MVVVILVHGICHNDPLLTLHAAIPISLAVVWKCYNRQAEQYSNLSNLSLILIRFQWKINSHPLQKKYQFLTTKLLKHTATQVQWAQQYTFLFPTFLLHASAVNYHLQAVYHVMCKSVHFYSVVFGFHVHTQKWYKTVTS